MPAEHHYRFASAADCDICSQLRNHEGGGAKERDDAWILPPAVSRLVSVPGSRMNSLEKCPLCGTYYSHYHWYEYCPSGNEEEAHLRRLTAAEALAELVAGSLYPELEDFASRDAAHATMVLAEINRSGLKRDTADFMALQSLCQRVRQK